MSIKVIEKEIKMKEDCNEILVSVTIATFNRSQLLDKVLYSLINQSVDDKYFEVIICDSNSADSTTQVVENYQKRKENIKHIHTKNILAAKRNIGIKHAIGAMVVFLDDDCIPEQKFLEKYISIAKSPEFRSEKCVYCGHVVFPEDWVRRSNYYRYRDSRHYNRRNRKKTGPLDFRTIIVMNMGFNRQLFTRYIQEVNEKFIGYGYEDQELGWRLMANGFEIKLHDAYITHLERSGGIDGYGKKIYYSAKDGMSHLLKYSEDTAKSLGVRTYLIDPDLHYKYNFLNILKKNISRIIFNQFLTNLFIYYLKITDHISLFYSPSIYRYVIAHYYVEGANARGIKKNNNEWYD